ncbi:GtrA family protein [Herbaspirillum seropedicae]|uniref:GtrA family protein n=1 Tax=Herbaspirillum seropedicae TaxID=964 RepID=UPI003D998909
MMIKLWTRHSSILRFLCVGAANTVFGYGCFVVLLRIGLHYSIALLLATVIGVIFNFKTIGYFVFKSRNNRLFVRFVASYAFTYGVNVAGIKLLTLLQVSPAIGGMLLLLPMALLAYILNKRFVFSHEKIN